MNLGSFGILLPFFQTSWCVGVLNSAIFNSFHNQVEFGTILEGLQNFGGRFQHLKPPPPRYATAFDDCLPNDRVSCAAGPQSVFTQCCDVVFTCTVLSSGMKSSESIPSTSSVNCYSLPSYSSLQLLSHFVHMNVGNDIHR